MKKAIVTLVIGKTYEDRFNALCRESWSAYCARHGYDLIVINTHLDSSERAQKRSPAWQKLLILSINGITSYDRVVWVDSDIMINLKNAYDVANGVPLDKIGAVESYSIPTRDLYQISLKRCYEMWEKANVRFVRNYQPHEYYLKRGIPGDTLHEVVQTGVLVCSPAHHRQLFEKTYLEYEDTHGPEWNYEMPALSYEILKANRAHWISSSFNMIVPDIAAAFYPDFYDGNNILKYIRNIYDISIFCHFAGCANLMPLLHHAIQQQSRTA